MTENKSLQEIINNCAISEGVDAKNIQGYPIVYTCPYIKNPGDIKPINCGYLSDKTNLGYRLCNIRNEQHKRNNVQRID